jgi:AcrR family transcriptional regulator
MIKGEKTKDTILKIGWEMAGRLGLECVTIGTLAEKAKMSKSGLFAHFQSKENLQIAILEFAASDFREKVIIPALKTERGIPRIKALVNNWIKWGSPLSGNCIFVITGTEFSARPGKVRDYLMKHQDEWIDCLQRIAQSAIKAGDFRDNIDCQQFAFDLYSLLLGFHYYDKLLHNGKTKQKQELALKRVLDDYSPSNVKAKKTGISKQRK